MKALKDFKKEMLNYAKTVVDLEPGETPKDWVDAYIMTLREDNQIVRVGRIEYVKD